ncbi:MAG: nuclear transport factor 2 family protein [Acidobacteriota bacterium]|nr:nuclear transport factor 2 family protein [Acidobacteriota bacterium]
MTAEQLDAIRALIERLNAAWLEGRYDDLEPLFHPTAVLVAPGFTGRLQGRAACIQSYRDFGASAGLEGFEPAGLTIDGWDRTAVVSYSFAVVYQLEGARYRESGRDLLVVIEEAGSWRIAWRTLLVETAATLES